MIVDIFSNYCQGDELIASPIWYRLFYCYVSVLMLKTRLYIAWILSDAVNNAAGLGFNGYKPDGSAKWDLVTNIYPFEAFCSFWDFLGMT